MPQLETYKGEYLWPYVPNLPAAVLFAVIFTILTAAHTHKMMTTKLWFCTPFVIGSICMSLPSNHNIMTSNTPRRTPSLPLSRYFHLPYILTPPLPHASYFLAPSTYLLRRNIVHGLRPHRSQCTWLPFLPRLTSMVYPHLRACRLDLFEHSIFWCRATGESKDCANRKRNCGGWIGCTGRGFYRICGVLLEVSFFV